MFRACKRSFYLQKMLGIEPVYPEGARNPGTADTGTLLHLGIETHYSGGLPSLVGLNELYIDKAIELSGAGSFDALPVEWRTSINMAIAMTFSFENWVEVEDVDHAYEVKALEKEFEWEVPGLFAGDTRFTLTGHADMVVYDELTDRWGIGDNKSVAKLSQLPRKNDFQLRTYGLLLAETEGIIPEFGFHNMVVRNMRTARAKGPFEHRAQIVLGENIINYHRNVVIDLLQDIATFMHEIEDAEQGTGFEDAPLTVVAQANPNGECNWKCRAFKLCDGLDAPGYDWRDEAEVNYVTNTNGRKALLTDTSIPGKVAS